MKQKVFRANDVGWKYFMSEKYLKWELKRKIQNSNKTSNDFRITGKYLFFHTNPKILENIALDEIENNGFDVAKISTKLLGSQTEYVLCLYNENDSRKQELAKKYQEKNGIKYRYWKSDKDTLKGKYSKQFLDETRRKEPENS